MNLVAQMKRKMTISECIAPITTIKATNTNIPGRAVGEKEDMLHQRIGAGRSFSQRPNQFKTFIKPQIQVLRSITGDSKKINSIIPRLNEEASESEESSSSDDDEQIGSDDPNDFKNSKLFHSFLPRKLVSKIEN